METLLGLLMIASWTYSIIIIINKIEVTTTFEKTVLIFGLVTFVLYVIGTTL